MPTPQNTPVFGDPRLPLNFWSRAYAAIGGCWLWIGAKKGKGYAQYWQMRPTKKNWRAHRFAYDRLVGPCDGLLFDHLCRHRLCVNPLHLEAVSNRENLIRGVGFVAVNARKRACPNGHQYDGVRKGTQRFCKTCQRLCQSRYDRKPRTRQAYRES